MARLFDRLSDFQLNNSLALKAMIDQIETQVETQYDQIAAIDASQNQQLADIEALLDPNTLTPADKTIWIFMQSYLTGEQSDLDAKATSYSITTEKTNYDSAISALTTYLAALTTPVAWNDTSGNTTIVDATFRSKFTDVLTKKQLLINAITAAAKVLADAAQSTANTAQSTATTAQSTATTAQSTANTANTAASNAQTAADVATRNDSISTSWTSPGAILSASDAGSSATITIASHTRHYTDATSKSVTGGSLTGLSYSTGYYVYYDQTSRAGGSVTYHAVTNPNTALANAAAGRHYCGYVATPAAGGGTTSGGVSPPSGGGGDGTGLNQIP